MNFSTSPESRLRISYRDVAHLRLPSDCSPEERVQRMATMGGEALYGYIAALNSAFNTISPIDSFRPGGATVKDVYDDGRTSPIALSYSRDFQPDLLAYAAQVGHEVADSDLSTEESLRRVGNAALVLVAEGQLFSDANHQTARAIRGLAIGGRQGVVQSYNSRIDPTPPDTIEALILRQNMARLASGVELTPRNFATGIYVDSGIDRRMLSAQNDIDTVINDLPSGPAQIGAERWQNLLRTLAVRMMNNEDPPEYKTAKRASAVWLQRSYGAAALSLVYPGGPRDLEMMDAEAASSLVDVNTQLTRMRIKSLITGVAFGGQFAEIKDSEDPAREPEVIWHHWEPNLTRMHRPVFD